MGSLFDGIGGFPLAASRHGIKTLWASEIKDFPTKRDFLLNEYVSLSKPKINLILFLAKLRDIIIKIYLDAVYWLCCTILFRGKS